MRQRSGEGLGVGKLAGRLGLARLRVIRAKAVKFFLPVERRLVAAALLCQHVEQHGVVLRLEKLEGLNQEGNVMPVEWAVVMQAKLLEEDGGPQHAFGGLFGAARHFDGRLAADLLDDAVGLVVQILVVLVGDDSVKVAGDGAHIAVDGPLVVVENHDQPLGLLGDVVHRLECNSVGKSCVAGHGDYMLLAAGQVARHGHAQRGR